MFSHRKVLVVGYGSIGSRHCRLLQEKGHTVAVVSKRPDVPFVAYKDVSSALKDFVPDFIIVSNSTVSHFPTLKNISDCNFQGAVLIEKPLFDNVTDQSCIPAFPVNVAYNLRFHPIIQKIRETISGKNIYSAQFYVGQYLPQWRPGTDYRRCYSAHASQGGGVLRDLSHELDLALWLTGSWKRVTALGGKFSDLEIDSDDVFCLLLETTNCPAVSIQVNYLDLNPRRKLLINGKDFSVQADLVSGKLAINDDIEKYDIDRDYTYSAQLEALLHKDSQTLCSYSQGMDVMTLIDAAEKAVRKETWVRKN